MSHPSGSKGSYLAPELVAPRPAPSGGRSIAGWLRRRLFGSVHDTVLTLVIAAVLAILLPPVLHWAVLDAVWTATDPAACAEARGACWAVVYEKHRVMLFGFYPYEEHYRPLAALLIFSSAILVSAWRRLWRWQILLPLWLLVFATVVVLLHGGVFGLPMVNTRQWGGVSLTMVVFMWTIATALPLGILVALGRRSSLPVFRYACVAFIETARGVPLVSILFVAAIVFPLFMPSGWELDVLLRVLIALTLYYTAYFAEVVRGGLQAIPAGQYEAAASLGLRYWPTMFKVVLPQAIRTAFPGIMNYVIIIFKNSTYVVVVGLFDLLNATRSALSDPLWLRYHIEAYLFVALAYFAGAFALSLLGAHVERSLMRSRIR